jgi:hypothetical protein
MMTRRHSAIGRWLFAAVLGLFGLTAAGYLAPGDEETMYRVTRNLGQGQGLAIGREVLVMPPAPAGFLPSQPLEFETTSTALGRGAAPYSKYFIGQSLLALPLFGLGQGLDRLWPAWPQLGPRLVVALLNPLVLAATVWLLYHFALGLGYSPAIAVAVSLAYGLTTMAWPYVNTFYPQPASGFFLLATAYALHRWRLGHETRWAWAIGLAFGLAMVVRLTTLIALPGLALVLWGITRPWPARFRLAWAVGWPLTVALGLSLGYNWLRFGDFFSSGYNEVAWTTPPILGLYGLLFSSGKSIFLYAPLLLLALAAMPLFLQQQPALAWLILGWWLSFLAFYAPYNFWTGGFNWGPRFLLPLVALSLLPCAALLQQRHIRGGSWLFVALFLTGLAIQLPAVVVDHARYLIELQESGEERFYDQSLYLPNFSPVFRQGPAALRLITSFSQADYRARAAEILQQQPLPAADSPANQLSSQRTLQSQFLRLNVPAIWWLHLPLWGISPALTAALALPWLGLFGVGSWRLLRSVKD